MKKVIMTENQAKEVKTLHEANMSKENMASAIDIVSDEVGKPKKKQDLDKKDMTNILDAVSDDLTDKE